MADVNVTPADQSVIDGQHLLKKVNSDTYDIDKYGQVQEKYYTAAQVKMFINSSLVDEFTSIRFVAKTDDGPAYSYNAKFFNTLIEGKFSVMGSFSINFTKSGYLMELINKDGVTRADAKIKEAQRVPSVDRTKMTRDQLLTAIWGPTAAGQPSNTSDPLDALKKKLFTISLTYGDPSDPFSRTTVHRISVCKIVSVEQQVLVPGDGNAIQEIYNFIARAIDDPNDVPTGREDNLFIPKLPAPTAVEQKLAVMKLLNKIGERLYTYLTDPDNLSFVVTPMADKGYIKDTPMLSIDSFDKYAIQDIAALEAAAVSDPGIGFAYQNDSFAADYTPFKAVYNKMFTGLGPLLDTDIKKFARVTYMNTNGFLFKFKQFLRKGSSYAETEEGSTQRDNEIRSSNLVETADSLGTEETFQAYLKDIADKIIFYNDDNWRLDDFVQHDVQTLAQSISVIGGFDFKPPSSNYQVNVAAINTWYQIDNNLFNLIRGQVFKNPKTNFATMIGNFVVKNGANVTLTENVDYKIDRIKGTIKALSMPTGGAFFVTTPTILTLPEAYNLVLPESNLPFSVTDYKNMKPAQEETAREILRTKRNLISALALNSSRAIAVDLNARKLGWRADFQIFLRKFITAQSSDRVRVLREASIGNVAGSEYANLMFLEKVTLRNSEEMPYPDIASIQNLQLYDAAIEKNGIQLFLSTDADTALETYTEGNTVFVSITNKPANVYIRNNSSASTTAFAAAINAGQLPLFPFIVAKGGDGGEEITLAEDTATMMLIQLNNEPIADAKRVAAGDIKSIKLITDAIGAAGVDKYTFAIEFTQNVLNIPMPGTAEGSGGSRVPFKLYLRALTPWSFIVGSSKGSGTSRLRYTTSFTDAKKSDWLNQSVFMFISNESRTYSNVLQGARLKTIVPKIGMYVGGAGFMIDYATYIDRLSQRLLEFYSTGASAIPITKDEIRDAIYSGYQQFRDQTTISSNRSTIPNQFTDENGMAASYRFYSPPLTSELLALFDSSKDPIPENKTAGQTFKDMKTANGYHILKANVPFEPTLVGRIIVRRVGDIGLTNENNPLNLVLHGLQSLPQDGTFEVATNAAGVQILRYKDANDPDRGYGELAIFHETIKSTSAVKELLKFMSASGAQENAIADNIMLKLYGKDTATASDPRVAEAFRVNALNAHLSITIKCMRNR